VTARTAEAFSVLDIAGMNYGDSRYELDKELFPNRIIVGTETFPASIGHNWALVEKHSHVLGDFTWTGWDYLGESGAGRITYLDGDSADATPKFEGGFPWLTAWTGDIDITGHRRPVSYFRETVFGLRKTPYIAVQRPETFGRANLAGAWSWSDSVSGWSWDEQAGRTAVEVYSSAEEIELLLNGRVVGREPAGRRHGYIARFELEFEPGELTAVGYVSGEEQSRSSIRSAGSDLMLAVTPERTSVTANTSDLAYIPIEVRDTSGNLSHAKDRSVTVEVAGAGVLQGLGSGRPDQRERYDHATHTTFDGRVLAIVRPTGAGIIDLTVTAEGLEPVSVQIVAAPATGDRSADLKVSVTA
jgi:beta-galactosidase